MPQYDLTNFFNRLGIRAVKELRDNINNQVGVDGKPFAKLVSRVGKRMILTGDFLMHAFEFIPSKDEVAVFVTEKKHGRSLRSMTKTLEKYRGGDIRKTGKKFVKQSVKQLKASQKEPTMSELVDYQSTPDRGLLFPVTVDQVANMKVMKEAPQEFFKEIDRQTKLMIQDSFRGLQING